MTGKLFKLTIETDKHELAKLMRVLPADMVPKWNAMLERRFAEFCAMLEEERRQFEAEARKIVGSRVVEMRRPK